MSRYTKSMTSALQQVDDRTKEFDEEVKWEVKITGLPTFYSDGKSRGEVKQALRKLLKRPDDIISIERTTPAALKKIRRGQAAGTEPGDDEEVEKVKEEVKVNRIIKAQNESLDVDDIVNMIQFGHPFKVVEDIPAELPPGNEDVPRYKDVPNSVVDKEDKKANKVKDKIEKEVLKPTQTEEGVSARRRDKDREASMKMGAVPGGRAEEVEIDEGPPTPKFKPLKHKVWSADASIPVGAQPKNPGKIPKYKVKKSGMASGPPTNESELSITQKGLDALRAARDKPKEKSTILSITKKGREALEKDKRNQNKDPVGKQHKEAVERISKRLRQEVAPPGWGHTKAEKEKTKPNKPKSKIGGTAHEFDKDLKSGKFKGLPGDKTYKDKKASMFKLMWAMKNKGDKPHYKPGEKDKLKSKYKKEEHLLDSAKRYVIDERADWETAFKSASQSRPAMKYKDAVAFIETAGLNTSEKRSAIKSAKKWLK